MPLEYRIDRERRRIVVTVTGDFTMEEIVALIDTSTTDPDFEPGFDVLSDHTGVGRVITPAQAQGMVAHLRSISERVAYARWAVVATKAASYGMLRMVAALAEAVPMTVEVFSTVEEAEAWLGETYPPGQGS